jgi:hypothetical protein
MKLLQVIKQIMYSNISEEIHTVHNQLMATINLSKMREKRGQSPQNFQELQIGQLDQGAWAILKKEGVTNPNNNKQYY